MTKPIESLSSPDKQAIRDGIGITEGFTTTGDISVPDESYGPGSYGPGWNGSTEVPTKNAIYDKIEASLIGYTGSRGYTGSIGSNWLDS